MAADTQPVTGRAGTKRVVEGKQPRLDFINGKTGYRTGEIGGKDGPRIVIRVICKGESVGKRKRGFQRIGEAGCQLIGITTNHQPVNNHLDIMLALLVERRGGIKVINLAIDPHTAKALAVIFGKFLAVFTFASAHYRGQ